MGQFNNHDYYLARAEASRASANRAVDPAIAAIYAEFADRYESIATQMEKAIVIGATAY